MRRRFDQMFEHDGETRAWMPAIDVEHSGDALTITAELPGMKPEEIDIEVASGVLTISGRHEESEETKDKTFVRRERRYGAFTRSVALPEGVSPDDVEATCTDGVLTVRVPLPKGEAETVHITPKATSPSDAG
jgi:HSP20 family protein